MKRTLLFFSASLTICCLVQLCEAKSDANFSLDSKSTTTATFYGSFQVGFNAYSKLEPVLGDKNATCVYGKKKIHLESAIGMFYLLMIQLVFVGAALLMFIAPLAFIPFSLPGFMVAYFVLEISLNDVFIKSAYFKNILGPGEAYVSGETANRLMFILYTVPIVITRIGFVFGSFYLTQESFRVEGESNIPVQFTGPRAVSGLIASWALMIYSTKFLYKHGIVSYFTGTQGDTLNGIGCSGPYSYKQLPFIVLLLEILPLLLPLFQNTRLTWLYNAISLVCCLTIVITGFSTYYFVNATVFIIGIALSMLLQSCIVSLVAATNGSSQETSVVPTTSRERINLL